MTFKRSRQTEPEEPKGRRARAKRIIRRYERNVRSRRTDWMRQPELFAALIREKRRAMRAWMIGGWGAGAA